MPHYKNGDLAKAGDLVIGKPYNTPHHVLASVAAVTSEGDTCNLALATHVGVIFGAGDRLATFPFATKEYGEARAFNKVQPPD